MRKLFIAVLVSTAVGFAVGKIDDHVRPTMWGFEWTLEPAPNFPTFDSHTQFVSCGKDYWTFPPWHIRVIWDDSWKHIAPSRWWFWQERGV